jgi:acyl carrier protein
MNTETARKAIVRAIGRVAPEADVADLAPDEGLREGLDLDSLDFLAVLENVALTTGVSVPESDYAAVDNLEAFVAYLQARAA